MYLDGGFGHLLKAWHSMPKLSACMRAASSINLVLESIPDLAAAASNVGCRAWW